MVVSRRKLLACTSLEATWGSDEPLVFLGDWCKRFERSQVWSARTHSTVPFHWDDGEKLKRDYFYLAAFHQMVLECLAASLNDLHGVSYDRRYWQILIDPWLLSYLAVIFDRWESLRVALEKEPGVECVFIDGLGVDVAPFSYHQFLAAAFSDEWNQQLYQDILQVAFPEVGVAHIAAPSPLPTRPNAAKASSHRRNIFRRSVSLGDRVLGTVFPDPKVAFVGSTFNLRPLARLNLALRQMPRLHRSDFAADPTTGAPARHGAALPERATMRLDILPKSQFEEFVGSRIIADLPRCLVEDYPALRARAAAVPIRTKAIVTGGSHWDDVGAKFWFADQVNKGTKLVIVEHGGSLPPFRELFDFEENVADVKATWFTPYHPKHTRVPPARLIGRFARVRSTRSRARYCSAIANECARWVHRVHFYPMAGQWSKSFQMVIDFHGRLDTTVRDSFRVKPPQVGHWNARDRFVAELGPEKITSEGTVDRVFEQSRVVVCTYPETTFAEAMASDVPTILMYPPELYRLNPAALPLLDVLKTAGIVFHDTECAAAHVNAIWSDPDKWWTSSPVANARAEFRRQAIDLDSRWVEKWTKFLRDTVKK